MKHYRISLILVVAALLFISGIGYSGEPVEATIANIYTANAQFEVTTVVELNFSRTLTSSEKVVFHITYEDSRGNVIYRGTAKTQCNLEGYDHIYYLLEGKDISGLSDDERAKIASTKAEVEITTSGGSYVEPYKMEELNIRQASIYESFIFTGKYDVTFENLDGKAKYTRGVIFLTKNGGEPATTWGGGGEGDQITLTVSFNPLSDKNFRKVYAISGINLVEDK